MHRLIENAFGRIAVGVFVCAAVGFTLPALAQSPLRPVFTEAKPIFAGRLRFEFADQDGFFEDAKALTARARFGFETGELAGFRALVEGDFTRDLAINDFNSTVNGKTRFPVVGDPDSERLNRLQLSYTWARETVEATATVGRQRIKLDNDRFVGNVGFRQNEQTYDAAHLQTELFEAVHLDYTYLWQVNRIFGSKSPAGEADADTHLVNARIDLAWGELTGYAYLMDLDDSLAGASNQTYGLRLTGEQPLGDALRLLYTAEYAQQRDDAGNRDDFNLSYLALSAGLAHGGLTVKAGLERLEGNGDRGFATPLATLHKFQGFADAFLTTPGDGIRDIQAEAQYRWDDVPGLGDIRLAAWFHSFRAERGSADFGTEIDWGLFVTPWQGVSVSFEYAEHFDAGPRGDLRRFWTTLTVQY